MRGVILAAGLGKRLGPLTDERPKPLLPVRGVSLLERSLARLAGAGCEAVAVNLFHLGDQIEAALGSSHRGMEVIYSREAEILGTLGALVPLRGFLSEADFVFLINGDSLCEWPLEELLERHLETRAEATVMLSSTADPAAFGPVGVDASSCVVSWPGSAAVRPEVDTLVFAGAHVFSPDLLRSVEPGFSGIVSDLYVPLVAAGATLAGMRSDAAWHDLGTPRRYLDAVCSWRGEGRSSEACDHSWVSPRARVARGAMVDNSVVEASATIGPATSVRKSLLMEGSEIGEGSELREVVVGPGARLPAGSKLDQCLVTKEVGGERLLRSPLDPPR